MRVTVMGGTGLIGGLLSVELRARGHDVVVASRATGVDAVTGRGVSAAIEGSDAVVDALGLTTVRARTAIDFFGRSTATITTAVREHDVPHLLTISIAQCDSPRVRGIGYYRGKAEQLRVVRASGVPATVIASTQWYELAETMLDQVRLGRRAFIPRYLSRPVAAAAVAARVADLVEAGRQGQRDVVIAGPRRHDLADLAARLGAERTPPVAVTRLRVPGFGGAASGALLPPDTVPGVGPTFDEWLVARE